MTASIISQPKQSSVELATMQVMDYAITIDNTIGTIEARFVEDGNNDGRLTYQENE